MHVWRWKAWSTLTGCWLTDHLFPSRPFFFLRGGMIYAIPNFDYVVLPYNIEWKLSAQIAGIAGNR